MVAQQLDASVISIVRRCAVLLYLQLAKVRKSRAVAFSEPLGFNEQSHSQQKWAPALLYSNRMPSHQSSHACNAAPPGAQHCTVLLSAVFVVMMGVS